MAGDGHAHNSMQECSGQGKCAGSSGVCICRPGFVGEACDMINCGGENGDVNNMGCGGEGTCQPLHQLAKYSNDNGHPRSIPYGFDDPNDNYRDTWDRSMIRSCQCSGGYPSSPKLGPTASYISGIYVNKDYTQQHGGFACHLAICPYGDDPDSPGVPEEQQIAN